MSPLSMSINQILQPSETCNDEKKSIAKGSIKSLFLIYVFRK